LSPAVNSELHNQLPFLFTGLAQRAAAILERMERCSPISLQHFNHDQINSDGLQTSNRLGSIRLPQHLPYTKHALPYPTNEIYNMVMLLYAKESGPSYIAQQAEDVIWSMIERFMQQKELNRSDNEHIALPSKENWDCVLRCWSISTAHDRAIHAHLLMESWNEWNKYMRSQNIASKSIPEPDIDSHHLVLESCIANTDDRRVIEMGSRFAIRFWDEMKESPMSQEFESKTYSLLLRLICQISEVKSKSSRQSFPLAKRIFHTCCENGLLTVDVLDVMRAALSNSEFLGMLGNRAILLDENGNIVSSERMVKLVPIDWIINTIDYD
jgi:hypothetical protein